jgi:hypothetical protein
VVAVAELVTVLQVAGAAGKAVPLLGAVRKVVEDQRWFGRAEVALTSTGGLGDDVVAPPIGLDLDLRLEIPGGWLDDSGIAPSVMLLVRGTQSWGCAVAVTWATQVRLGGSYRLLVHPGTYQFAALYLTPQTRSSVLPRLLAVGEGFSVVCYGDDGKAWRRRPSLALLGRLPDIEQLEVLGRVVGADKMFRLPEMSSCDPRAARGAAKVGLGRPAPEAYRRLTRSDLASRHRRPGSDGDASAVIESVARPALRPGD